MTLCGLDPFHLTTSNYKPPHRISPRSLTDSRKIFRGANFALRTSRSRVKQSLNSISLDFII